ncbi:MAG: DNA polymerase I [Deltaproteobacteria bacterium]|nr:MAG: DNA polymerase I [Deltaproteobacteria bacterium]
MARLFLIDGTAVAYRSHFAFIRSPLKTSQGEPTSAIFGFVQTLRTILEEERPDYVAVVFDTAEPTFRHEAYADYKATREKMPDELAAQLPAIEAFVDAFQIPALSVPGYEADDVMATLAKRAEAEGIETFLVSGDKDFAQLVTPRIRLYVMQKGKEEILGPAEIEAKFGVPPERFIDYLALVGDPSDNVPGVPGIGPKKAQRLLARYGSLDAILAAAPSMPASKDREKLIEFRDQALLSRRLVTIDCNVPLDGLTIASLKAKTPDLARLTELYRRFEFHSLLDEGTRDHRSEGETHDYRIIETEEAFKALLGTLSEVEAFSFDLETTSLDPLTAEIVGLSFAVAPGKAFYLPANQPIRRSDGSVLSFGEVLTHLRPLLEESGRPRGGQNSKYDIMVLRCAAGIEVTDIAFDTMIAAYLLDPTRRNYGLDHLCLSEFHYKKIPTEALIGEGKKQITMKEVAVSEVARYACEDADFTLRLHERFSKRLSEFPALLRLYREVELPLVPVLARMEIAGIAIDPQQLERLSEHLARRLEELTRLIHEEAGEEFNINSPKQLGEVLFEKLRIHERRGGRRPRKTKIGFSTDVATLERFAGEKIIDALLEYRSLMKLKGTYTDALLKLVHPKTGRIHTSFNQTSTATGRLSSSDPNLQNIPIRTPLGRLIRAAFVPGEPGDLLLSADYSQIELRLLAHLSGDPNLIETFRRNQDVHRRTAELIFGVAAEGVTPLMRSRAKAINFGVIYGMGPQRLARETGLTQEEAQRFIAGYFEKYPGIQRYIDEQIERAKRLGYVETILGRRRRVPDISSRNARLRVNAEHIAVNTPIQGSAADLIKLAMIRVDRLLRSRGMKSRMLLQVHDELVFEAPPTEIEELSALVRREMESAISLTVPLRVDIGVGENWLEAH